MIKETYFAKHSQFNGVDNLCVNRLLSQANLPLTNGLMFHVFLTFLTVFVISNIILFHLLNQVEVACVQAVNHTKSSNHHASWNAEPAFSY